jgi:phage host-nuclease inhibitor protein Gam
VLLQRLGLQKMKTMMMTTLTIKWRQLRPAVLISVEEL